MLSHRLVGAMGLAERWPRFIALWNWCNVVQYLLLVVFSIPGLLGAPALLDQVAQLFALGWALWLEWFAFRLTLGIGIVPAAGLVALDVAIGVLLAAISLPFGRGSEQVDRIAHAGQAQPIRRRRGTGRGAIARGEGGGHALDRPASIADQLQRPHHVAHLMVQEAARLGDDLDQSRRHAEPPAGRACAAGSSPGRRRREMT